MNGYNKKTGAFGEKAAAWFLRLKGYRVLARNFQIKNGEIDIVAEDRRGVLVFVEVKTRTNDKNGSPADAVGYYKRKHLADAANVYLAKKRLFDKDARFDVIEVMITKKGIFRLFKLNHIKNAFEV